MDARGAGNNSQRPRWTWRGRAAQPARRDRPRPTPELDTAGALALVKLRNSAGGERTAFINERSEHRILLDEVARAAPATEEAPPRRRPIAETAEWVATTATAIVRDAIMLTTFLGQTAAATANVIVHPSRFRGTSFVHQIQQTGLTAVPIIALVCFLIGGVVLQQGARQLRGFGAENLSIDMLGILALREVGIILASVMVAGRSASAFTAQIGTMKMREEIDAMRTLGIDPTETLVVPRILALIVALPLLVFVADVMCLAGGALMAKLYLSLDLPIYLQRLNGAVQVKHLYVGLIKAPFAALVIGLVGCLEGLSVQGSAEFGRSAGHHRGRQSHLPGARAGCGVCDFPLGERVLRMNAISPSPDLGGRDYAIRVRGLTKRFGRQLIFENLDLDVMRGEILGIAGGSGSGKSVLLRSILGLLPFDAGTVEVFGKDFESLSSRERIAIERQWGVLFQDGALFPPSPCCRTCRRPCASTSTCRRRSWMNSRF